MSQASHLHNRGIIKISGKDRFTFLQGLVTNDIEKITKNQGIFATLLSPQGKFQYDLFIWAGPDCLWMDCDLDRADSLLNRLSMYKLRSDVSIENLSDQFEVTALYGSQSFNQQSIDGGYLMMDPRLAELGARLILPKGQTELCLKDLNIPLKPYEDYNLHRIRLGVPDAEQDVIIDRGILLECGFEELNAIDWNKGCYMGQELTARTKYRGLIRKRLLPVVISGDVPSYQSPIFQEGAEVGEMRSHQDDQGIAMIRLEALQKSLPFSCGNATLTPHIPGWMSLPSLTVEE